MAGILARFKRPGASSGPEEYARDMSALDGEDGITIVSDEALGAIDDFVDIDEGEGCLAGEGAETNHQSLPVAVRYGFHSHMSHADIVQYVTRWARDNYGSPQNSFYQTRKYGSGYLYEIHNGGPGKGALSSIIKLLETESSIFVPADERNVRILKDGDGIQCLMATNSESFTATHGISFSDKMTRIEKPGTALALVGIGFAAFGVVSLFGAALVKFAFVHRHYEALTVKNPVPYMELSQVAPFANNDATYVSQMLYEKGKWEIKTSEVIQVNQQGNPLARQE